MLILLTDVDGQSCLVQSEFIGYAVREKKQGPRGLVWTTHISFGTDAYVRVRETPEEIYQLVQEAEWEAVVDDEEDEDGEEANAGD